MSRNTAIAATVLLVLSPIVLARAEIIEPGGGSLPLAPPCSPSRSAWRGHAPLAPAIAGKPARRATNLVNIRSERAATAPIAPDPSDLGPTTGDGGAEIGRQRPALEVDALDGTLINEARVSGRPLVVDFFATWCQPCHRGLADLLAARDEARAIGARIVLVDLGESPDLVRTWATSTGIATTGNPPGDVTVATDPLGIAARRWGARRLPTTFIVDAAGVIRHINRGWGPGYRARLLRWLRDLDVTGRERARSPSAAPAARSAPPSL